MVIRGTAMSQQIFDTNNPVIFDSTCIYDYNKCKQLIIPVVVTNLIRNAIELLPLRPVRHRMRKEYIETHFKEVNPSEPEEDHDDRNVLYCL